MKKLILSFFVLLSAFFTLSLFSVHAEEETFDLTIEIQYGSTSTGQGSITETTYGSLVSLDLSSFDNDDYDFLGYIIQGKVAQTIEEAQTIRVTEDMDIRVYFKPAGTIAVIFMDSNHDFVAVEYTDVDGKIVAPAFEDYKKPGLTPIGWNVTDITNHVFTEDTIVYLEYENASGVKELTADTGSGVVTTAKDYNSLITLTADGSGEFSYWLKDGIIVSLEETYTFTMVDNHTVEAVYDDETFVKDSDTLVSVSKKYLGLTPGFNTIVGQFSLGANEAVVEWGILASNMAGGITFDTPGVHVVKSTRYNEVSQEYMMSFDRSKYLFMNYRGFVKTINTITQEIKTTYSYYQVIESETVYASDLIISEYGEGGSNNKWIEIYNGTGAAVDLSGYNIKLYTNGASEAGNTQPLSGTLAHNETYTLYNSSSVQAIKDLGDIASGVANFNGDDAIGLYKGLTLIDAFGQIGVDPGSEWSANDVSTVNMTLVRKPSVVAGDSDGSNAFDPSIEWTAYAQDTFTNIGTHTMTLGSNNINIIYTAANTPSTMTITGNTSVNLNETIQLTTSEDVVWLSSNEAVATVSATGLVTGTGEGTAVITAYSFYNHSVKDTIEITGLGLNEYDVTFNNEGVISVVTIDGGTKVTEPADPTKAGFMFEGWFTEATYENLFDFDTNIQNDTTLYAKLVEISSILDFRTNGTADYLKGIITGISGSNVFLNDGTAAINIFNATLAGAVSVGDEVLFKSNTIAAAHHELVQFGFASHVVLSSENDLPSALNFDDFSELGVDEQRQRVSISGLNVVSVSGSNLVITDGTITVSVKELTTSFLATIVNGQGLNLINIHVGWYDGLEFTALSDDEVQLIPLSDAEKVAQIKLELVDLYNGKTYYSNSTINLIATSSTFGGTISWSSSNESVVNTTTKEVADVSVDTPITLTATINVNGSIDTQTTAITIKVEEIPTSTEATLLYGTTKYTNSAYSTISTTKTFSVSPTGTIDASNITFDKAFWAAGNNTMRLGSSSANGWITYTFDSSVTILEVKVQALEYDSGSSLTVGGISYNMTNASAEYIFDISDGNTFTLSGTERVQIVSVTIVYSE